MKKALILLALVVMNCKSSTVMMRPEAVMDKPDPEVVNKTTGQTVEKKLPKYVDHATPESVAKAMNFLASDELKGRDTGSEGIEKAAGFIEAFFSKNEVPSYFEAYKDTLSNFDKAAFNVVGVVPGKDSTFMKEYIIIGAHYDHIGKGKDEGGDTIANGANDNASGTTAVMELASYFSKSNSNKRSLIFALFSAEEKGLLGSAHLAKKLKAQNIDLYGMVNFEMIGVPFKDRDYEAFLSGYELSNMAERFNDYAGTKLIGFSDVSKKYSLFKRSDNYPFYQEFGIPCHTVSSCDLSNFDYYHHVDDESDKMDYEFMAGLINKMIPVIEEMSNTSTKEIKMNE